MTRRELIDFENDVADSFLAKKIRGPVHLSGGNEQQLIEIFERIRPRDWVLTTWRSHYHCLLKGVPKEDVMSAILAGKSISLCFPEHRVISSGIVAGMAPIAVGLAMANKRSLNTEHVWCFLGDMGAHAGIVHESIQYARAHSLPVTWVIEDNKESVGVWTEELWGSGGLPAGLDVIHYKYKMTRPHVGVGQWVTF